jgi:hypothetical protein
LTLLERLGILLVSICLSVGLIALLTGVFASHDQGTLSSATVAGHGFRDLGDRLLRKDQRRPRYDSNPPTSGAHFAALVTRDEATLNNDQLLGALAAGDVVILYGTQQPPAGLTTLAQALAPPFTPGLAQAGQAVILGRRPGTSGLIGLAWAHMLRTSSVLDPRLREFAAFWLGRGAPPRPTRRHRGP